MSIIMYQHRGETEIGGELISRSSSFSDICNHTSEAMDSPTPEGAQQKSSSTPKQTVSQPFWYGSEDSAVCQEIFKRFAKHLKVEESHTNVSPRNPNKREPDSFVGKIVRHVIPAPTHFETIDAIYMFSNVAQPVDGHLTATTVTYTNTLWNIEDAVPGRISGLHKHTYDDLLLEASPEASVLLCQPFYMQSRRYRFLVSDVEPEEAKSLTFADSLSVKPSSCCFQHDTCKECLCQHHYSMDHRERSMSCEETGSFGADSPAAANYLRDHGLDVFLMLRDSCCSDGLHDTDFSESSSCGGDSDESDDSDADSDCKGPLHGDDMDEIDLTECEQQRCFDEFETMVATVSSESLHSILNPFPEDGFGDDEHGFDLSGSIDSSFGSDSDTDTDESDSDDSDGDDGDDDRTSARASQSGNDWQPSTSTEHSAW